MFAAHVLYIAAKDENEIWKLKDFEREGTKRYLYTKRCEEEQDKVSKTADTTQQNKINKTEKKTARIMHT